MIYRPVITLPSLRLLLEDKPRQREPLFGQLNALKPIKVPTEINLLPPKTNEMLTAVWTNKFGDVTYAKYKSVTPRVIVDGIRAAPEQVKVVPLKEKKKRAPLAAPENDEKHQWMTTSMLHDKIQNRTEYTHAL